MNVPRSIDVEYALSLLSDHDVLQQGARALNSENQGSDRCVDSLWLPDKEPRTHLGLGTSNSGMPEPQVCSYHYCNTAQTLS